MNQQKNRMITMLNYFFPSFFLYEDENFVYQHLK